MHVFGMNWLHKLFVWNVKYFRTLTYELHPSYKVSFRRLQIRPQCKNL